MIKLRAATAEDAQEIDRLSQELGYGQTDANLAEKRLQALLDSDADFIWVAESDKQLRGWVHAFVARRLASAAFVEIGGLVVGESSRRQGVGRALVQQVREHAQNMGMPVRVRCNAKRTGSVAFYQEIGLQKLKFQDVLGDG